ncbi:BQ2448_7014 [Microbotryum intermedium]|uniref:BQ2448_7014 protein n=1 Tax=Microbotryum intermedium TaxID=269621 RepID=A0A238FJW6_9BASI|nr:BQ2448_7014 [Microbotryum intermedium]
MSHSKLLRLRGIGSILRSWRYVTQIGRNWRELGAVLAPRRWYIHFHTTVATVVQSGSGGDGRSGPGRDVAPRAKSLRTDALRAIHSTRRAPASIANLAI